MRIAVPPSLLPMVVLAALPGIACAAEARDGTAAGATPTAPHAGDVVESDRWYVGVINGRPSMSMHSITTRHGDGGATYLTQQELVELRSLQSSHGAEVHAAVGSRETDRIEEDAQGRIVSFVMDEDSADVSTLSAGRITRDAQGQHIHAVVHRLGRSIPVEITVPADEPLIADDAMLKRLAKELPPPAHPLVSGEIIYLDGLKVGKVNSSVTAVDAKGVRHVSELMDLVPIPMISDLDPAGAVVRVHMDFGVFAIDCTPCAGTPKLLGAEIPSSGVIANAGAQPQHAELNRYRLPAGAQVMTNEFQDQEGGLLTVRERAVPGPLKDPAQELASEPLLETDDPQLRAWSQQQVQGVAGDAARAEALRAAVRSYVTADLATPNSDALQTFRSRHGACTEHAALLCAALRIVGIPARIETGVIWAADYGGWVGHAWNSAYVDGAWLHLDSAFPGVPRSCYLALAQGSGGGVNANVQLIAALSSFAHQPITTLAPR